MKKLALAVVAALALAIPAAAVGTVNATGGVSISSTQYHYGASEHLVVNAGESLSYSVSGTWVGLARLESSRDGANFAPVVGISTGGLEGAGNSGGTYSGTLEVDQRAFYRLFASSWTSGGFVFALADRDDFVREILNNKKKVALTVSDDTITIPGALAVGGTITPTGNVALTSATLTGSLGIAVKAKAFFDAATGVVGASYLCSNCVIPYSLCVGTGTTLSGWKVSHSATVGCGTNN